ncbi:MAG: hypothetical protein ACREA9_19920 [Pyrinomonadaceae bacterium]
MEPLETPEQLQWISNLAHWIEGGMFGVVAVMALLQAFGRANSRGAQYVWPGLVFIAGLFLPSYILLQRGPDEIGVTWAAVIRDPQQREHFLMALLLLTAGLAEILIRAKVRRTKLWGLVAPSAFFAIGVVLFVHTEYGTPEAIAESVQTHRYMGVVIALAGVFKAADVLWRKTFRWLAFPWIALLLIAALLLITYREPYGAYRISAPIKGEYAVVLNRKE